jgi:hypothetical protein
MYMSAPCAAVVDSLDPAAVFAAIHIFSRRSKYVNAMAACVKLTFFA